LKHKEFIDEVAQQSGIPDGKVSSLSVGTCSLLSTLLSEGELISIQGFGTFEVKKRKERLTVNPATGKKWLIPPKLVLIFKPGPTLKERIRHLMP